MRSIMTKHTLLRAIIFLFFLVMAGLVLYEIDLNYYQQEKKARILDNKAYFLNQSLDKLSTIHGTKSALDLVRALLRSQLQGEEREAALAEIHAAFDRLIGDASPFYAVEIVDRNGRVVSRRESVEKRRANNRFPDALFLGDFASRTNLTIRDASEITEIGNVWAYYTSPRNEPALQRMAWKYLWVSLVAIPLVLAPFFLIDGLFLRPQAKIMALLDAAAGDSPTLLRPPDSNLALRYNDLARDALLQRIEQHFHDPGRRFQEDGQMLADLPRLAVDLLGYPWFFAGKLWKGGAEDGAAEPTWEASGIAFADAWGAGSSNDEAGSKAWAERLARPQATESFLAGLRQAASRDKRAFAWLWRPDEHEHPAAILAAALPDPDRASHFDVLLAGAPYEAAQGGEEWEMETFERLVGKIERLRDNAALERRLLARERSEANVSLARNLGHDLTNIIAASKLDMAALRKLVDRAGKSPKPSDAALMRETLDSLQDSARFMQEVVNVYRSFSYLKRPTYEKIDIRSLLDEIIEVFRLSTGVRVRVEKRYQEDLPLVELEPRLMKLALFNILTNALDAMKRRIESEAESAAAGSGERYAPSVTVDARMAEDESSIAIVVQDNGPGIRDANGVLMSPEEVGRVFSLGYSTKPPEEGEGLGLNWVSTIARDFHSGRVQAENAPGGGARFTLEIPVEGRRRGKGLDAPARA